MKIVAQGACISTTSPTPVNETLSVPLGLRSSKIYQKTAQGLARSKKQSRLFKISLIASNLVIVAVIVFFVLNNPKPDTAAAPAFNIDQAVTVNPLDQVSSADIALNVAKQNNLPETTAVANQAQTAAADQAMAATDNNVVTKPSVVTTALKSRANIQDYVTAPGDSVANLASRFGVTSTSIQWSNGLTSDSLSPGTHLVIPPVNGVVYTVQPGDTPDSLAAKFHANSDQIIAYNDAEISGLTPGEQIIIPNGLITTGGITEAAASSGSFPWGGSGPVYGSNGYDYGYCTWYVATQIPVPSNWGNASSWSYYAGLSGWNVSGHPAVGSIAQTPFAAGGEGHVAIVNAVSPDGSQIQIRDMNGVAGWGRVGFSGWISTSTFVHYITP